MTIYNDSIANFIGVHVDSGEPDCVVVRVGGRSITVSHWHVGHLVSMMTQAADKSERATNALREIADSESAPGRP